jgi:hypothetical protein
MRVPLWAIIQLPAFGEPGEEEAIFIGRRTGPAEEAGSGEVLLLKPGGPVGDLAGLRAYLGRCRARVQEGIKTPSR